MSRQLSFTDYDGFVEKFKPKKTTDDCIRPEQLTWTARHPETVFFCHDLETFTKILGL